MKQRTQTIFVLCKDIQKCLSTYIFLVLRMYPTFCRRKREKIDQKRRKKEEEESRLQQIDNARLDIHNQVK